MSRFSGTIFDWNIGDAHAPAFLPPFLSLTILLTLLPRFRSNNFSLPLVQSCSYPFQLCYGILYLYQQGVFCSVTAHIRSWTQWVLHVIQELLIWNGWNVPLQGTIDHSSRQRVSLVAFSTNLKHMWVDQMLCLSLSLSQVHPYPNVYASKQPSEQAREISNEQVGGSKSVSFPPPSIHTATTVTNEDSKTCVNFLSFWAVLALCPSQMHWHARTRVSGRVFTSWVL